jgi:uncharacterized protein (DUF2147 family)
MRLLFLFFVLTPWWANSQSIIGKWKTIDDNTGEARSVVEIYEKDGKVYGKIVKLFRKAGEEADPICDECPSDDARHNQKIIGMDIIRSMDKKGDEYSNGDILDPEVGKIYRCKLWIENNDLMVRGYWGPFFRTQVWKKFQ